MIKNLLRFKFSKTHKYNSNINSRPLNLSSNLDFTKQYNKFRKQISLKTSTDSSKSHVNFISKSSNATVKNGPLSTTPFIKETKPSQILAKKFAGRVHLGVYSICSWSFIIYSFGVFFSSNFLHISFFLTLITLGSISFHT